MGRSYVRGVVGRSQRSIANKKIRLKPVHNKVFLGQRYLNSVSGFAMTVAPRSYYFLEKVEKILKAELKSNYCSLYLSSADLGAYKKGFGKCPPDERDDEVQKIQTVELIVVCKNSRDALGDKGSRIRFMQHKINVAFGSLFKDCLGDCVVVLLPLSL